MKAFGASLALGVAKVWTWLIVIVCIITWLIVGTMTVAEKVWGVTARTVATASMVPTYDIGDLVWYTQPTGADLAPGRAVAIAPDGDTAALCTHRVVSVEADGTATLAGDAFVDEGVVDVFHPTQADVRGVPFAVTKDSTATWLISSVQNELLRTVLTALGLGTLVMWMVVNFGLNRRDEGQQDVFAARFHEIEGALVERGLISPVGGEPSVDDPLDILDSASESTRT